MLYLEDAPINCCLEGVNVVVSLVDLAPDHHANVEVVKYLIRKRVGSSNHHFVHIPDNY